MKYFLLLIYPLLAPLFSVSASLINVKDVYLPPVHYLNFTPQITVPDGYFRLLLPVQEGQSESPLPQVAIEDQPGFTFSPPVAVRAGVPGCIPLGHHCFTFPYQGTGDAYTPLVISLTGLSSPAAPFAIRHYDEDDVLIDYTVGHLSDVQGVQVTAAILGKPSLPPLFFGALPSLPATITKLTTREGFAIILPYLLALGIILLLILIWRRRYNILIIDSSTGSPYRSLILYHSIPTTGLKHSAIFATSHSPILYDLRPGDHGRLYIPRLGRYSTLTIRINPAGAEHDSRAYVLSLSITRHLYTIILG